MCQVILNYIINTGRLVVNTTLGILGIFDPASEMGFPKYVKEDYGQTLELGGQDQVAIWFWFQEFNNQRYCGNVCQCDGGDPYNISVNGNNEYLDGELFAATRILSGVELEQTIWTHQIIQKNSVDFYASVKSLHTQDRENKIKNIQRGNIEVIYKEDEGWEEIDTK